MGGYLSSIKKVVGELDVTNSFTHVEEPIFLIRRRRRLERYDVINPIDARLPGTAEIERSVLT